MFARKPLVRHLAEHIKGLLEGVWANDSTIIPQVQLPSPHLYDSHITTEVGVGMLRGRGISVLASRFLVFGILVSWFIGFLVS